MFSLNYIKIKSLTPITVLYNEYDSIQKRQLLEFFEANSIKKNQK